MRAGLQIQRGSRIITVLLGMQRASVDSQSTFVSLRQASSAAADILLYYFLTRGPLPVF
jgi:hypothetical protein